MAGGEGASRVFGEGVRGIKICLITHCKAVVKYSFDTGYAFFAKTKEICVNIGLAKAQRYIWECKKVFMYRINMTIERELPIDS